MNTCFATCIPKKFLMNEEQLSHLLKLISQKLKRERPQNEPALFCFAIFPPDHSLQENLPNKLLKSRGGFLAI